MIEIIEVSGKKGLLQFIDMAWDIYRYDRNWVPPLRLDLLNTLLGKSNPLFMNGSHSFFLAREGDRLLGRICVGIDQKLNSAKGYREGYISLFECVHSYEAAESLFGQASQWLRERGMETMKGPISPTNGDDYRGLLVQGFDGPPVLMNSYNPPYYPDFFDRYGFEIHNDFYAFYVDVQRYNMDIFKKALNRMLQRFEVDIRKVSFFNIDRDMADIKRVFDEAMPEEWPDLVPLSLEELQQMGRKLRWMVVRDGILIARCGKRPVGFIFAQPDYNQVFRHMNGRLFPLGIFKFLWYQRKIDGSRIFGLYVVPDFQRKAVPAALLCRLMETAQKRGYTKTECSTIGQENRVMWQTVEAAGAKKYRTYRMYQKEL